MLDVIGRQKCIIDDWHSKIFVINIDISTRKFELSIFSRVSLMKIHHKTTFFKNTVHIFYLKHSGLENLKKVHAKRKMFFREIDLFDFTIFLGGTF